MPTAPPMVLLLLAPTNDILHAQPWYETPHSMNRPMKSYINNAGWMLLEKIVKALSSLIIIALIARTIGPSDFGVFSLALSVLAILWCICSLGLDSILIKEFSQTKYDKLELFSTIFWMRFFISALLMLICFILTWTSFTENYSHTNKIIFLIIISSLPFYNFNTFFSYYQAQSKSRFTANISLAITLLFTTIKILFAATNPDPIIFSACYFFESATLIFIFTILAKETSLKISHFRTQILSELLKPAYPLLSASLLVIAYTKLDQVMIAKILGPEALGIYSVSTRIAETYIFIPTLLSVSLYPMLAKNFTPENTRVYFDIVYSSSVASGILVLILSPILIPILFGNAYKESITPLSLLIFASIFSILGMLSTNFFLLKEMPYIRLYRAIIGLAINFFLNLKLIPIYGINGAAFASLLSQITASWFLNALSKKTIECFKIQCATLFTFGFPGLSKALIEYKKR